MPVFDWRTILPLVFAAPFFVFGILNWRQSSTRGSVAYMAILSVGTALSCLWLAAQAELRIYCGALVGLSVGLAFYAKSKFSQENFATAQAAGQSSRSLVVPALLSPVAAGLWTFLAWRQLTEAPDYGDPLTPFRVGWLPPDWLSLYPHALVCAFFTVLGLIVLRLEEPRDCPAFSEALHNIERQFMLMQLYLAMGILRKVEAISLEQAMGWLGGLFVCIAVLALSFPGDWPGSDLKNAKLPLAEHSSSHWRLGWFYWNPSQRSPRVRTEGGIHARTNWASPVAYLEQLSIFSFLQIYFLG